MGPRHTPTAAQGRCGVHSSEYASSSSRGDRSSQADNKRKVWGTLLPKPLYIAPMAVVTQWVVWSAGRRITREKWFSSAVAEATSVCNGCNCRVCCVRARRHGAPSLAWRGRQMSDGNAPWVRQQSRSADNAAEAGARQTPSITTRETGLLPITRDVAFVNYRGASRHG